MQRLDNLKSAINTIDRCCNAAYPEGDREVERQELLGAIRVVRESTDDLASLIAAFTGEGVQRTPFDQVTIPECKTTHEFRQALKSCGAENDRLAGELRRARAALAHAIDGDRR